MDTPDSHFNKNAMQPASLDKIHENFSMRKLKDKCTVWTRSYAVVYKGTYREKTCAVKTLRGAFFFIFKCLFVCTCLS